MSQGLDYSFSRSERMKLRKNIHTLFQKGEAFSFLPFRIIHHTIPQVEGLSNSIQVGISVPKKKIKTAVKRNLIKRRIREAWRTQKHQFTSAQAKTVTQVFLIYQSNKILPYQDIAQAVQQIIQTLNKKYK